MSRKFNSNRSVDFFYHAVPIYYTGIKHATNNNKELVLIDDFKSHYIAAYRNDELIKVGINFILKKERKNGKLGFVFKDKYYPLKKRSGWVY
jgi:hypothetical protein